MHEVRTVDGICENGRRPPRARPWITGPSLLALLLACAPATVSAQGWDPDLNDDGVVDIFDLSIVGGCLGQAPTGACAVADSEPPAGGDGDVDMDDLNAVLAAYGTTGWPTAGGNAAPVADAGPDRTVSVGSTVTLAGAGSTDADGDPLTYAWSFQYRPPGSAAALSGADGVSPSFLVDAPGTYVIQLVVDDGVTAGDLDTVRVTTDNSTPAADAGPDQSAPVGATVTLDGSGSSDADGDLLSYSWTFAALPAGSGATLSDPTSVSPTFTLDVPGDYVLALVVNDGVTDSLPDSVTVSSLNSPPVADAGADQSVLVGQPVELDGSGSSDGDGDPLSFAWSLTSVPSGSAAALSDPSLVRPIFVVDRPGDYVAQLRVNDGTTDSAPDTVVVSTRNSAPTADAGPDTTARVGDIVTLDGTGSSDADFDTLDYQWSLTSRPPLSTAALADADTPAPSLVIDRPGTYVGSLVVNDGQVDSAPDSVTITTVNSRPSADAGADASRVIGELVVLDGSGSSDPDFDTLTFRWALTSRPPGSATTLADAQTEAPSLVPDMVGTYLVQLIVNDGTVDSDADTVTIEVGPPQVTLVATPTRGGAPLDVSFSAQILGGFPPFTHAWDIDGDGAVDDTRPSFVQLYQSGGVFNVTLTIGDAQGNSASDTQVVEVLIAPQVEASATPTEGTAPLDVAFSAVASDPDGSIVRYEWDFNGDGSVDQSSATTASGAFRYDVAGRYEATLVVTDDDGITASDTVVISVGIAPELDAAVTPLTGDAPLEVTFSASATDPDGVVVRYEWDFEGDGVIDYSDPATGDTTHTYDTGGVYPARVNVFDDTGLIATRTFIVSVAGPPVAEPRAHPTRGEAPLTVTFFSDGIDIDGSPEFYDWDFDGDGTRDVRLIASMNATYTYTTPGTYLAELKVVDDDGLTGTATVTIEVLPGQPGATLPAASGIARPPSGGSPLRTRLIGTGSDPDGSIVEYAWDFEGDGTYDFVDPVLSSTAVGEFIDAGSYSSPLLYDVDGDGDRDLLIGNSNGQVMVYSNIGTEAGPAWGAPAPLLDETDVVIDVGSYAKPVLDDADGDGDLDLLVGNSGGQIFVLENTGGATAPRFANRGPLTQPGGTNIDVGSYANPLMLDHDGDGDLDMVVGESGGRLRLVVRDGTPTAPTWTLQAGYLTNDVGATIDIGSYAAPMLLPRSAPALDELLVGNSSGWLYRLVNVGTAAAPVWQVQADRLTRPDGAVVDVGSYADPILFDLVDDGEVRLLVGDSGGDLTVLTERADGWEVTMTGYNRFDVGSYAAPALADLDDDLDLDLMIGNSSGQLYLRRNQGDTLSPSWFLADLVRDDSDTVIDVGSYAAPELLDVDDDGDYDAIVGNSSGWLYLLRNDGDAAEPVWVNADRITNSTGAIIDVGSYATPAAVDYDLDGDLDLLVGDSGGRLRLFRNDGDATAPIWTDLGYLSDSDGTLIDVGSYAAPALDDPDANGTQDLQIGNSSGVIVYYENRSLTGFDLVRRPGVFEGIDVGSYASPALVDIDDDGDRDLFVGNSNGLMAQYRRYGQVLVEYGAQGPYTAVLRVTDDDGQTATDTVDILVLSVGSPSAIALANPTSGIAPLTVEFSGHGIDGDGTIAEYAWDFDGDGTFDFTSTTGGTASHVYDAAGVYDAVLRVTDNDGLTATDTVRISVDFELVPSLPAGAAFDPGAGEQATVQTAIRGGEASVTVRIVDERGNPVRTLVNGALRSPGEYQDLWSGLDDDNQPVRDGVYYVIVEYTVNGETTVVDLRDTASFDELTPSRSFSSSFNPYEGVPVLVTYTSPWPAEVSLYFWTRDYTRPGGTLGSIAPVRTLFLRLPRPPARYTDVWDGFDDNGVVVEPGRQYPVTLWLYRLAGNAIIVTGNTPQITGIDVAPRYLSPVFNPYGSGPAPNAVVSLTTTKQSTLQAQVVNQAGLVVRRITAEDRAGGANTLTWDGRDSEGNLVAPGTYSIGVTAIDAQGNRSLSRYVAVTVRY